MALYKKWPLGDTAGSMTDIIWYNTVWYGIIFTDWVQLVSHMTTGSW